MRFDKLKYKVHTMDTSKPVQKQYASFFDDAFCPELPDQKHLAKVFAWICYLFDPNSDLVEEHEADLVKRKKAAAVEAGFTKDKAGNFVPYFEDILEFRDEKVNRLILHFLRLVNNNLYRELITLQVTLDRHTATHWKLMNDPEPNYSKIEKSATFRDNLEKEIAKKIRKFRGEYEELEDPTKKMMITPENIMDTIPEIRANVEENGQGYY